MRYCDCTVLNQNSTPSVYNYLLRWEDLFASKSIDSKEYLKSASLMIGRVVGQNTNTDNVDQATAYVHSVGREDENEDD